MSQRRRPTQRELADRYGISRRTVQAYAKCGVDVFNARAVRHHQAGLKHGGLLPGRAAAGTPLVRARAALTKAQADRAELIVRRLRRELVDVELARSELQLIRACVRAELEPLILSLPPQLAGQPPDEMERVIRGAVTAALERLSDVRTFTAT